MKRITWQGASVLGLVLMIASAVTAAVQPASAKSSDKVANNGTLDPSTLTPGQLTCNPTANVNKTCVDTITGQGSDSTVGGEGNSAENATEEA
jgi:hypothetical protein